MFIKYSIFCEKKVNHITKVFSYDNNELLTANKKSICESIDEDFSLIELDEDWRNKNEIEQHKENDEIDHEIREINLFLLRFTKKKHQFSIREKSFRKRDTKRHRFSSSFFSNLKINTNEKSNYNIYTSCKEHDVFKIQFAFFQSINFNENANENNKMKTANERFETIVIYEQQSWKKEIIDEKNKKQKRERFRKQYLVRWKFSWMNDDRFIASNSVQIWKKKRQEIDDNQLSSQSF